MVTPTGTSGLSVNDQYTCIAAPVITGISPAAGPVTGGSYVLIAGANLANVTAVDFGGSPGTIVSASANALLAVSPAGSVGSVDVTVANAAGTSATSAADKFSYAAAPTVTGNKPASAAVAGGTKITIAGTNLANAIAVVFGNEAVTGFITDTAGQIVLNSPAGTNGTVDVTVVTAGGPSPASPADLFTLSSGPPPVLARISPQMACPRGHQGDHYGLEIHSRQHCDVWHHVGQQCLCQRFRHTNHRQCPTPGFDGGDRGCHGYHLRRDLRDLQRP